MFYILLFLWTEAAVRCKWCGLIVILFISKWVRTIFSKCKLISSAFRTCISQWQISEDITYNFTLHEKICFFLSLLNFLMTIQSCPPSIRKCPLSTLKDYQDQNLNLASMVRLCRCAGRPGIALLLKAYYYFQFLE